jgi:hypothetical protein
MCYAVLYGCELHNHSSEEPNERQVETYWIKGADIRSVDQYTARESCL